jgi:hypothetical protein
MISHQAPHHIRHICMLSFWSLVKSLRVCDHVLGTNVDVSWWLSHSVPSCPWSAADPSWWCPHTGPLGNMICCIYPETTILSSVPHTITHNHANILLSLRSLDSCIHRAMSEMAVPIGIYRSASYVISSKCWIDPEIIPSHMERNTHVRTRLRICVGWVSTSVLFAKSCMYVAIANKTHQTTHMSPNLQGLSVKWTIDPEMNHIHRKYISSVRYQERSFCINAL